MPVGAFVCGVWLEPEPDGATVVSDIDRELAKGQLTVHRTQPYVAELTKEILAPNGDVQQKGGELTKAAALYLVDAPAETLIALDALNGVRRLADGDTVGDRNNRASIESWLLDRRVPQSIATATTIQEQASRIAIALNPGFKTFPAGWFD
jgi:hypothetical protein